MISGPHLAPLALVVWCRCPGNGQHGSVERVTGRLGVPGCGGHEGWQVVGAVEVVVTERVAERRMGPDERDVDEEGLITVAFQPVDDRSDHEGGLALFGGEPGRRPRRPVPVGTGKVGDRPVEVVRVSGDIDPLGGQPVTPLAASGLPRVVHHRPEPGQHLLVGAEPGVVGGEGSGVEAGVGVTEEDRVVAGLAGQHGNVGEAGVEGRPVVDRPVVVEVGAGVEAGPRRTAGRGVGPVVGEQRPACGQAVEVRCGQHRVTQR